MADPKKYQEQQPAAQKVTVEEPEHVIHLEDPISDFPQIIGDSLAQVMRMRTNIRQAEMDIDHWVANLPKSQEARRARLDEAKSQMVSAKMAIEALYNRFALVSAGV